MRSLVFWHLVAFFETAAMFSFWARFVEGGAWRWLFFVLTAVMLVALWDSIPKAQGMVRATRQGRP